MSLYKSEHSYQISTNLDSALYFYQQDKRLLLDCILYPLLELYMNFYNALNTDELAWASSFISMRELPDLTDNEYIDLIGKRKSQITEKEWQDKVFVAKIVEQKVRKYLLSHYSGYTGELSENGYGICSLPFILIGAYHITLESLGSSNYLGFYIGTGDSRAILFCVDELVDKYPDNLDIQCSTKSFTLLKANTSQDAQGHSSDRSTIANTVMYVRQKDITQNLIIDFNLYYNIDKSCFALTYGKSIFIGVDLVTPIDENDGTVSRLLSYLNMYNLDLYKTGTWQSGLNCKACSIYIDKDCVYENVIKANQIEDSAIYYDMVAADDRYEIKPLFISSYVAKNFKLIDGLLIYNTPIKLRDKIGFSSFNTYFSIDDAASDPVYEAQYNGNKINFNDLKNAFNNGSHKNIEVVVNDVNKTINLNAIGAFTLQNLVDALVHQLHEGLLAASDGNKIVLTTTNVAFPKINEAGYWVIGDTVLDVRAVGEIRTNALVRNVNFDVNGWASVDGVFKLTLPLMEASPDYIPTTNVLLDNENKSNWEILITEFNKIVKIETAEGSITGYCLLKPTVTIPTIVKFAGESLQEVYATKAEVQEIKDMIAALNKLLEDTIDGIED